ncbi:hypothetical protein HELRODRAFT_176931 [Helobdella robusta]|uniref:Calcium-activated potassium channel BK alpha subunit domain-containing protein n=1 Tax=Helobdella robusta TaxID=6412 RepID=T1FB20_HELRO|nr:hypothetical protein HELRODRAFT_176931 [Helobdella robusta]ESN98456.1 hypothetical protein HELRODRAFT_176931 [Helobdella robusta]
MFNVVMKLLSCVLYVARVVMEENLCGHPRNGFAFDPGSSAAAATVDNDTLSSATAASTTTTISILWVCRHVWFWAIQVTVAIISLLETLLVTYLSYKGNLLQQIVTPEFILELVTTVPFIITLFYPPIKDLFVPVFLNCWLAQMALSNMLNDLNRVRQKSHSALAQQLFILLATFLCLIFTSVCGFQHLQRGSSKTKVSLFNSLWFVIVTYSTVGYGDMYPDIWPSKLFIMLLICTSFIVLPKQIDALAHTWMERQKMGGSYSSHRAYNEKHVVVVSTILQSDVIMDFLNEFYAHPKVQDYFVVLLSPSEMDDTLKLILQVPIWAARVIYIRGSALKDSDLSRCRLQDAYACFFIVSRNQDKMASDQHTILRSWAVRDFAPQVTQYLQIFKPENKLHVYFAECLVCEDEFKYSLLANNCLFPGISTFMTLLLHTSDGLEGQHCEQEWMRVYGKYSGNEMYHVLARTSIFFGEYVGKSFTFASFNAHRKYGVCLVGVVSEGKSEHMFLNPGSGYLLKESDVCLYLSLSKEENAYITRSDKEQRMIDSSKKSTSFQERDILDPEKGVESGPALRQHQQTTSNALDLSDYPDDYTLGIPPVSPYIGVTPHICHLLRRKRALCCLVINETCEHIDKTQASDYDWKNKCTIVIADVVSTALFNFVMRMRGRNVNHRLLQPIIIVVEKDRPDASFLDSISYFPEVYWMIGSIDCLDDLLVAGITQSHNIVVVNKELSNAIEEDTLADCNTLVAVQTIYRLFPTLNIVMELSQASNMRFMRFRPKDSTQMKFSKIEKRERENGSHLYFMFRLPFAAGCVFSASMLDTILYQAFAKENVIQFVRMILGIDEHPMSGHLSSIKITSEEIWVGTYGRLYQKLCSTTREIPIGIYRTQENMTTLGILETITNYDVVDYKTCRETENMVRCRMESLGLACRRMAEQMRGDVPLNDLIQQHHHPEQQQPQEQPQQQCDNHESAIVRDINQKPLENVWGKKEALSYVIINPSNDLELQLDDIIAPLFKPGEHPQERNLHKKGPSIRKGPFIKNGPP